MEVFGHIVRATDVAFSQNISLFCFITINRQFFDLFFPLLISIFLNSLHLLVYTAQNIFSYSYFFSLCLFSPLTNGLHCSELEQTMKSERVFDFFHTKKTYLSTHIQLHRVFIPLCIVHTNVERLCL